MITFKNTEIKQNKTTALAPALMVPKKKINKRFTTNKKRK